MLLYLGSLVSKNPNHPRPRDVPEDVNDDFENLP